MRLRLRRLNGLAYSVAGASGSVGPTYQTRNPTMALSAELSALVDQAEATLIDARIALSQFKSANSGKAQRCDHSTYMSAWGRAQSQPWTITAAEQQMLDTATGVMTSQDFAAICVGPGDGWNPSDITRRKGAAFAAMGETARVASSAAAKPPVKNKNYYQKASMAGDTGRRECIAHAAEMGLAMWQYKNWLWKDEPRAATPGANPQAVAWAERQLRGA